MPAKSLLSAGGALLFAGGLLPWWLGVAFVDQNLQLAFAAVAVLAAAPLVRSIPQGAAVGIACFLVLMALDTARVCVNTEGKLLHVASWRMLSFGAAVSVCGAAVVSRYGRRSTWAMLAAGYAATRLMPEAWWWEWMESLQPGGPLAPLLGVTAALLAPAVYLILSSFSTRPSRM